MSILPNTQYTITAENPLIIFNGDTTLLITLTKIYNLDTGELITQLSSTNTEDIYSYELKLCDLLSINNCIRFDVEITDYYTSSPEKIVIRFGLFGINSRGIEKLFIWNYYITDKFYPEKEDRVFINRNNPSFYTSLYLLPLNLEKCKLDTRYPIVMKKEVDENKNEIGFFSDMSLDTSMYLIPFNSKLLINNKLFKLSNKSKYILHELAFANMADMIEKPKPVCYKLAYYNTDDNNKLTKKFMSLIYYVSDNYHKSNTYEEDAILIISASNNAATQLFNLDKSPLMVDKNRLKTVLPKFFETISSICVIENSQSSAGLVYKYVVYKYNPVGVIQDKVTLAYAHKDNEYFNYSIPTYYKLYPIYCNEMDITKVVTSPYHLGENKELYIIDSSSYIIKYKNTEVCMLYMVIIKKDFDIDMLTYNISSNDDDNFFYSNSDYTLLDRRIYVDSQEPKGMREYMSKLKSLIIDIREKYLSVTQLPEESEEEYTTRLVNNNPNHKITYQDAIDNYCCVSGTVRFLNILKRYRNKDKHQDKFHVSSESDYQSPKELLDNHSDAMLESSYGQSWISLGLLYSMRRYDRDNITAILNFTLFNSLGHAPYTYDKNLCIDLPKSYISRLLEENNTQTEEKEDCHILLYKEEEEYGEE